MEGFPSGNSSDESLDVLSMFLLGMLQKAFELKRSLRVSFIVGQWNVEVCVEASKAGGRVGYGDIFGLKTVCRPKQSHVGFLKMPIQNS